MYIVVKFQLQQLAEVPAPRGGDGNWGASRGQVTDLDRLFRPTADGIIILPTTANLDSACSRITADLPEVAVPSPPCVHGPLSLDGATTAFR